MSASAAIGLRLLRGVFYTALGLMAGPLQAQNTCSLATRTATGPTISGNEHAFIRVSNVLLTQYGVIIADRASREVHVFGVTGAHVRTSTRRGDGPTELRTLTSLALLDGDSVAVFDKSAGKVLILSHAGEHIGVMVFGAAMNARPTAAQWSLRVTASALLGRGPGSSWLVSAGTMLLGRVDRLGSFRDTSTIVLATPDNAALQRVATMRGEEGFAVQNRQTQNPMWIAPLFPLNSYAVRVSATEVATIDAADSFIRVHSIAEPGAVRSMALPFTRMPVGTGIVESHIERRLSDMPTADGNWRNYLRSTVHGDSLPSVSSAFSSAEGNIWLERWHPSAANGRLWYEVSPAGASGCILSLRSNQSLAAVRGDRVAVISTDSLDVPSVDIFTLVLGR